MKPIRLSALGRDAHVGDLYNYYNDNILPGTIRVLRQHVEINQTCEVESDFFFQLPHKYKRHVLKINSHLDQSIEGGTIDFKRLWFAGYLERPSTQDEDNNTAQVDVVFRITRRTEVLNQHHVQQKMFEYQQTTGGMATHLVEKVVYGAELIISMERALDLKFESKASAEGNIYLAAKAFFQKIIDSKIYHGERPAELDKINCTIFSSIDPGNVKKGTFEDSCKILRDAVSSSTNEEKWKPIEITLKDIPAQIEARIWSEKLSDVEYEKERHFAMMKAVIKESNVISKHPSINRVPPIEKVMCLFLDLMALFRNKIESFHSLCVAKRRTPEQYLSDIKPISDMLIDTTDWLMGLRKEIEIMCSLLSNTNLPMSDLEEIRNSVSSGKEKRTRVFILKMDYTQDPLIDSLAKFIGNQEPFKRPVFWIATSGKHNIEHTKRLLTSFDILNTSCSSLDNNYQVGLVPFSSSMNDGEIPVISIEYTTKVLQEISTTKLPDRSIQPSGDGKENQLPISSPANSMLFPQAKTPLSSAVFNRQMQLRTPTTTNNVKQLGPVKSVHLLIDEDNNKGKNANKKEPEMNISSSLTDFQIQIETSLGLFGSFKDTETDKHSSTAEEILFAEKYMREEVLNSEDQRNNNREEMLAKFVLTRPSRREFIEKEKNAATTILNRYPRLKDMKEAIEDEFKFLKNSTPVTFVESWKSVEKKVVARGKETLTRSPKAKAILEKLEKAEENYDSVAFTSLAFELLLHLLPNKTAKGKRTRTPTAESWPALFQNFDGIILPVAAASKATMMRLPGVLNINGQYFIKVDEGAIKLPSNVSTITLAFAYLTMYYYILNLNYPDALKNVFLFFEKLLQIEPSIFSKAVHVLYSLVNQK